VKRVRPTGTAKQLMNEGVSKDVIGDNVFFLGDFVGGRLFRWEELELVGTTFNAPETEFAADCAIAFGGSRCKVEVGGKVDCAADTTSVVRPLSRRSGHWRRLPMELRRDSGACLASARRHRRSGAQSVGLRQTAWGRGYLKP
jgi:hypothetical protein